MYVCVINNWFVWNMENMCNCKEITLITHEISAGQNSITRPAKPLTRGKCKIPVTVKWTTLFVYNSKNSATKYDRLHPGSRTMQCTVAKENYPPCRLIFLSLFPIQKKEREKEGKKRNNLNRKWNIPLSRCYMICKQVPRSHNSYRFVYTITS